VSTGPVGHALGDAEHAGEHDLDKLAELLLNPVVGLATPDRLDSLHPRVARAGKW
jgi:hypothetical protein